MKTIIFSVYDSGIQSWGRPFYMVSRPQTLRFFSDEVNRVADDNPLNKHPQDFTLYELGEFYDDVCEFKIFDKPVQMLRAVDVIKAQS